MPTAIATAILGAGASAWAVALMSFAISYVIASVFAPDEPEPAKDQGVSARMPSDPKNKLPVVYGKARVAGQTIFADISDDNQKMAFIIALSEGPVAGFTEVWWEDKKLSVTLNTSLNNVTDAVDYNNESDDFLNGNVRIAVFKDGGRCSHMESFSSRWNYDASSRTMTNVTYAYVELTYNREKRVTGLPSKLFFVMNGRTVDQLDDGDGNFVTTTTQASSNPVDCLVDYLLSTRYGCGESISSDDLDFESLYNHKTFCDNLLDYNESYCTFPSGDTLNGDPINPDDYRNELSCEQQVTDQNNFGTWVVSGTTSQAERYATNGVLNTNEDMDRNINNLTMGNGASFTYTAGKFGVISEGSRNVVTRAGSEVVFSEDNIVGKLGITGSGYDNMINEMTVKFTSPYQKYMEEQVELTIDSTTAYCRVSDGGGGFTDDFTITEEVDCLSEGSYPTENLFIMPIRGPYEPRLERTIKLDMVNNNVQARRVGTVMINQSRQNLIVKFNTSIENSDLTAGDIIKITHATPGWDGKKFRIHEVEELVLNENGADILGVSITCQEYNESDYTSETILLTDEAPNSNINININLPSPTLSLTSSSSSLPTVTNIDNALDSGSTVFDTESWNISWDGRSSWTAGEETLMDHYEVVFYNDVNGTTELRRVIVDKNNYTYEYSKATAQTDYGVGSRNIYVDVEAIASDPEITVDASFSSSVPSTLVAGWTISFKKSTDTVYTVKTVDDLPVTIARNGADITANLISGTQYDFKIKALGTIGRDSAEVTGSVTTN